MDVEGDFFLMCWREILLSSELYGETYIEERNIVLEPTVIYSVIIIIRIVKSVSYTHLTLPTKLEV